MPPKPEEQSSQAQGTGSNSQTPRVIYGAEQMQLTHGKETKAKGVHISHMTLAEPDINFLASPAEGSGTGEKSGSQ
jgi:hypothetical protein